MKPIFDRGPSLTLRLFMALLASVGLITVDHYTDASVQIRSYLTASVGPLFLSRQFTARYVVRRI
ncbi:MAG: hypothetical protein U5L01_14160 [Rheinheimera sp.]|nr:hypothetical protein [Rheinheimera sp.]